MPFTNFFLVISIVWRESVSQPDIFDRKGLASIIHHSELFAMPIVSKQWAYCSPIVFNVVAHKRSQASLVEKACFSRCIDGA